jgi:hypothetical protein
MAPPFKSAITDGLFAVSVARRYGLFQGH